MSDRGTLPTCVLGMYRSGTSVASRLVNLLGVDLVPEAALTAPAADNPKGYWEHNGITQINEEILQLFGRRWSELYAAIRGLASAEELTRENAVQMTALVALSDEREPLALQAR